MPNDPAIPREEPARCQLPVDILFGHFFGSGRSISGSIGCLGSGGGFGSDLRRSFTGSFGSGG
ncbi:MAG: hypothetical protein R3360_04035, partial [Alphaproteobacteria bacterium]|nr:hypothetical protein [Alphaproteobacteria bacterium]